MVGVWVRVEVRVGVKVKVQFPLKYLVRGEREVEDWSADNTFS